MCGFMLTTAFLSMWISNTATAAMMVPIAHAVLSELNEHRIKAEAAAKVTVEHGECRMKKSNTILRLI
jgi:di/tricarboxylate transporter